MAETEKGYYFCANEVLYYGDKSDLSQWSPLCASPSCDHSGPDCTARTGEFLIRDGQICFCGTSQSKGLEAFVSPVLYRMNLDGTGKEVAYTLRDAAQGDLVMYRFFLFPDRLLAAYSRLVPDGSYCNRVVQVTEDGEETLYEGSSEEPVSFMLFPASLLHGMEGDLCLYCGFLSQADEGQSLYRPVAGALEEIGGMSGWI